MLFAHTGPRGRFSLIYHPTREARATRPVHFCINFSTDFLRVGEFAASGRRMWEGGQGRKAFKALSLRSISAYRLHSEKLARRFTFLRGRLSPSIPYSLPLARVLPHIFEAHPSKLCATGLEWICSWHRKRMQHKLFHQLCGLTASFETVFARF